MGFDSQTCYILKEVGSNLDKNHIVFTVKILFEIFKEIRPELFKKDKKKLELAPNEHIKLMRCFLSSVLDTLWKLQAAENWKIGGKIMMNPANFYSTAKNHQKQL